MDAIASGTAYKKHDTDIKANGVSGKSRFYTEVAAERKEPAVIAGPTTQEVYTTQHTHTPAVQMLPKDAIIIEDKKIPIEIVFTPQGASSSFVVGIVAKSAEVNEDGVSILIDDRVTIKPPALVPLKLIINNTPYTVVFAGGLHSFGSLKNISFVRTTLTGE